MTDELRFDGKVAIITGAGQGLGRAHALLLASRGAKVVVNDLGGSATGQGQSAKAADAVVAEIKKAGGEAVANTDSVEDGAKIVKTAMDTWGRVDIVVNNAGILRDTSFQKMTAEDWDLVFRVHVKGAFAVTHAAWPIMREQGYGRIIFTTSAAGIYGNFGQANYAAAKLALVGFAQTLALEGEKKNIRANTIGPIAGSRLTETILPKEITEALKPEYVSPLVAVLSHESCTDNGKLFEVGGGYFAHLRWERTQGKTFKLGRDISPERLKAAWEDVVSFKGATHPQNVTESMQPVLSNLNTKSGGGNAFIDVDTAKAWKSEPVEVSYTPRDLALYALGVGAGRDPLNQSDLRYLYELHGEGMWALPSFAVIPGLNHMIEQYTKGENVPGLNYGVDRVLHGEQYTEVFRPLQPAARLKLQERVTDIFDKGKHAIVVRQVELTDAKTGELVARSDLSALVKGAGGWGGERGPSADINVPPDRAPDAVITEATTPGQGLLYRLSGDINPLHVDPEFATMFGFEKPILHGLCTYGIVTRAVINAFHGGDPRTFKSLRVRFADSVFPGETLKVELWKDGAHKVIIKATVVERGTVCISNAAAEFYPEIPKAKAKPVAVAKVEAAAAPAQSFTSADTFTAIGKYLAGHPELVKQVGCVYQFKLKGPDSSWVVDLKNGGGEVKAGATDKADTTLELSDADWMLMTSGEADPQKLFMSGKLKITGNVMASQKLEFLKKLDRTEMAASVGGAPAAAAASGGYSSADTFSAIGAYLGKNPELVKQVGFVFQFKLKDPDSAWVVDLKSGGGEVKAGVTDKADTTLELSNADWMAMTNGEADPQKLFMGGKLKITGNVMASQKLEFLKKLDKAQMAASVAPKAATSAAAEPAPGREASAPKVIAALAERLAKNPALAKELGARVQLKVTSPEAAWVLDFGGATPQVKAGTGTGAKATITLSDEALSQLASGEATPQSLFQHGAMRVDGDVLLAHRLTLFKQL